MKVVFAHFGQENLGLEYLSTVVKKMGISVGLAFQQLNFGSMGNPEVMAQEILKQSPDVVGFSVYTETLLLCNLAAQLLQDNSPNVKIVYGGIHASIEPISTAILPFVVAVFHGEALVSFPAWLEKVRNQESWDDLFGISFRDRHGNVVFNQKQPFLLDYTEIQEPDKELFSDICPDILDSYLLMTGFGCPFKCSYCEHSVFEDADGKTRVRQRSVDSVISELSKRKHKIKYIYFCDEVFGMNVKWLEEFSNRYAKEIGKPFHAALNPNAINERRVELLRQANCEVISVGVQTGSERIRSGIYGRRESNSELLRAAAIVSSSGIGFQVDRILGNPLETEQELKEALLFFKQLNPRRVTTFWLTLYPNLPIIKILNQAGHESSQEALTKRLDGSVSFGMLLPTDAAFSRWLPYATLHVLSPLLPVFLLTWLSRISHMLPKSKGLLYAATALMAVRNRDMPLLTHIRRMFIDHARRFRKKLVSTV